MSRFRFPIFCCQFNARQQLSIFIYSFTHLLFCLFLSSCNQHNNQNPNFGILDSAYVAQDTLMQKGIESSYEYHKTLTANEKLVYDVIAWGENSKGEFAIVKRGADNKADTVVKEMREGIIAEATLNNDVVTITLQNPLDSSAKKIRDYKTAGFK